MKKWSYSIIIIYGLILISLFKGYNHLYGSTTDWISQHSVLPEYFRSMFYETGRFVPNFAFNLGAGQNIYNYAYYGLLSPVILISYLLPFVSMTTYIQVASVILYLLFGVLIFKFINDNFKDRKMALLISLISLSISSINYNFHHHIMFVWYLPFLVLALIGVDRYIIKKKSDLVIISFFLVIMTNYYYSIGSSIVIFLYGVYKILSKNDFKIKESFKEAFIFGLHLIVAVLMGMIILLPTLHCVSGGRVHKNISLLDIIIPNFSELFYNPVGFGLVGTFLVMIICNMFNKKSNKSYLLLNVSLLVIFLFPLFSFILNGLLYSRGKVLLPFIPLYLYAFGMFYKNLDIKKINMKYAFIFLVCISLIVSIFRPTNFLFIIELLLSFAFIYISGVKKNKKFLLGYMFFSLIVSLAICNRGEVYIDKDYFKRVNNSGIWELYNNLSDTGVYRSYNDLIPKVDINKSYNSKYYSPGIYSSTYNVDYWKFYNFSFGNNMKYRNMLITSGSDNDLFYTFMGVRYITSPRKKSLYYKKIGSRNGINLYYNEDSYPIMYVPNKIGSYDYEKKLIFPYNMEYMMMNAVVDGKAEGEFSSKMHKADFMKFDDEYDFNFKKKTRKKIQLDNRLNGKIMYISFKMNKNAVCKSVSNAEDDLYISINGVKNKLTCAGYIYHNLNNNFEYVIPIVDSSLGLNIEFGKGEYNISDINVYYSDKIISKNTSVNNIFIDKKHDSITGDITLAEDNYVITSIPYDKGFKVFVNNHEVSYEKVNKAFLGFKIKKGENKIKIEYTSKNYYLGLWLTISGFIIFLMILIYERFRKKCDSL